MNQPVLCPDDLLSQARSGALNAAERAKLSLHLQRCASCRATWQLGQDFDAVLAARAGDDQIAARIAARVTAKPARRWFPYAAAAAALLTGSVAAAAAAVVPGVWQTLASVVGVTPSDVKGGAKPPPAGAPQRESSTQPEAPTSSAPLAAPSAAAAEAALPKEAASESPTAKLRSSDPGAEAHGPDEPRVNEPGLKEPSAAELFAQGNADRRNGKEAAARTAYRELQQRFPASVEAKVSLVSLGRLERAGNPAAALRHFDAYLAQSAHTTLAEEALFGRASSLQALGQSEREQATWRELLRRFPSSVYAERAEARLSSSP